jgi:hypothetical protein
MDKTFHSSSNLVKVILVLEQNGTWNAESKRAVTKNPVIFTILSFFTRTERDFRDMAVGMHHGRGLQRLLSSSLCYNSATNCVACSSRDSSLWLTDGLPKCKQAESKMVISWRRNNWRLCCCSNNLHGCSQTENTIALLSISRCR